MTSSPSLPDFDFRQIRPYGSPASRANAFEELASVLLRTGDIVEWPQDTRFEKFGNPDGGREGRGVLPNGDVWSWQAKYLFAFTDDEAAQITSSIVRALERDSALTRYLVVLPYDLPAGDSAGPRPRKSAHTRWTDKKVEWEALAAARGMTVEFVYVGAHELVSELANPRHAGRARYWFKASVLSRDAMHQRLADVVAGAGRRYSPKVHVEVDAVQVLDGLGRTGTFVRTIQLALASVRSARAQGWNAPKDDRKSFKKPIKRARKSLAEAEIALKGLLDAAGTTGPLPDVLDDVEPVKDAVEEVHRLLQRRHLQTGGYYVDQAAALYSCAVKAQEAYWTTRSLLTSSAMAAAKSGRLLVTGRAGVGKTHLFCDVASRRLAAGQPTLVSLGQNFESGQRLLSQLGALVSVDGALDEVLAVLDAAGEAVGSFMMLMLDALNESGDAERWETDLRVLASAVDRHPNVVLAVSCRTEFATPVVGQADGFAKVEHRGFAEATSEAVDRYTREYNLERISFPVLNPEYGNPLFLKLACEALATLGESRFSLGTAGLATVCNAFMEAVNRRLAAQSRCDFDESLNLVQQTVQQLAELGPGPYDRSDVTQVTQNLLPTQSWSKSLLLGLLREGILAETYNNQVAFGYQRLGDVLRALVLVRQPPEDLRAWYGGLGDRAWAERGTLGALAVVAPEVHEVEIIDLLKDNEGRVDYEVLDAFVESIVLRAPQHTTDRTVEIVAKLMKLEPEEWPRRVRAKLVRVACVPDHRLNADLTHKLLTSMELHERDLSWSEWLVDSTEYDPEDYGEDAKAGAVEVLLQWAWAHPEMNQDSSAVPQEVARLATVILAWMLTTPDRRVRDRATKGLVSVGERCPAGFAAGARSFRGCNDPYVIERLAGALCAVATRATNAEVIEQMAGAAAELVRDGMPAHITTRDYLRRISDVARACGWAGPDWSPPYSESWPPDAISLADIEALDADPDYRYTSVWGSLHGLFGDFGRYVVEPATRKFATPDQKAFQSLIERAIFTRVLDLGWTPERFLAVDQGRGRRRDGPVERYGKKYQWIGLHEVLGRATDNHKLREPWARKQPAFDYAYPEQFLYRDIDPTVLVHGGLEDPIDNPWFAPSHATFPDHVAEYPIDTDGVPDPLDLIALRSPGNLDWLSLVRHASWTQVHPPEIEALNAPNLNIWMQIRGYLTPIAQTGAVRDWATNKGIGQDWDGRWMAENVELHSLLLSAHPHAPEWEPADGNAEPRHLRDRTIPVDLYQPIAWYAGTGTSRDQAGTAEATGFVPSRLLFDALDLNPGKDFHWSDRGGVAVADPTAGMDEASTLVMRRDLAAALAQSGYTLFWTVLLNKQRHDHTYGRPKKKYRWISASASYLLTDGRVDLLAAKAWVCKPVPGGDPKEVPWSVRASG